MPETTPPPRAAFAPWDRRQLPGLFDVEESAHRVGHYKWVEMRLFEALGGWVATVPELDVKLVLGRHTYHHAWHSELWHKRLPELREMNPDRLTVPPNDELVAFVKDGRTVGELIRHYAEKHTGNGITGTPRQIADYMEEWFETRAADGFILMFPTLPSSLDDFVKLVVPELRRRGIFREEYEGSTLRENLGLSVPTNRHTSAKAIR